MLAEELPGKIFLLDKKVHTEHLCPSMAPAFSEDLLGADAAAGCDHRKQAKGHTLTQLCNILVSNNGKMNPLLVSVTMVGFSVTFLIFVAINITKKLDHLECLLCMKLRTLHVLS